MTNLTDPTTQQPEKSAQEPEATMMAAADRLRITNGLTNALGYSPEQYGVWRVSAGTAEIVVWADSPLHANELNMKIQRKAKLSPRLPVYVIPALFVGADLSRIPADLFPSGALGRVIVALG